jgi:hypothetical protein
MTTATLTASKHGDRASLLQALLGGVALALVVPVLALSGMAIPLPGVVYRLAVDLVERSGALTARLGGGGTEQGGGRVGAIQLTTGELRSAASVPRAATPRVHRAVVTPHSRPSATSRGGSPGSRPTAHVPGNVPSAPAPEAAAPAPAAEPAVPPAVEAPAGAQPATPTPAPASQPEHGSPSPPAPSPAPAETPVQPPLDTGVVGNAVDDTVATVDETVDTTVGTVSKAVDETVGTVETVVEQLPPLPVPPLPKLP